MAHFRGTAKGNRTETSRLGYKSSGLITTCNGWNVGVRCEAFFDEETKTDEIRVYRTGGSINANKEILINIIKEK